MISEESCDTENSALHQTFYNIFNLFDNITVFTEFVIK